MSQLVKEFLEQKDGDFSQYIPAAYQLNQQQKLQQTQFTSELMKYQIDIGAKCVKPCFQFFDTPVIADSESTCFTNCVGKGLELMSHFQLNSVQFL
eukprot:403346759